MSFKLRSYDQELLDGSNIPFEDIKQNMLELDFINTHLGGHKITLKGLKALAHQSKISIAEIGCGGGDNLRAVRNWAANNQITASLTGIDINWECIKFAKERVSNSGIDFICSDYRSMVFEDSPDIIFASLFCHHFRDDELVGMLQWMNRYSKKGFFINDLHRHSFAYYSIKFLTQVFSKSYMVKNDAPLSVKKGFLKTDWESLLTKAGIRDFQIEWHWAFRWLIICRK